MKLTGITAILALLLSSAAPSPAGQAGSSEEKLEQLQQRLQVIKERLELTPEQAEQVRPVLIDEVQQLKAVREKYSEGDQSRRARLRMARELRGIQSSTDDKLRKILSKKQMEEMKKIREEWRRQMKDRRAAR